MDSNSFPSQPIAVLRWEHKRLDNELNELAGIALRPLNGNAQEFHEKLDLALRLLESHQEAEERFLFPLILSLDEEPFLNLKKEHKSIFQRSDIIASSTSLNDPQYLSHMLSVLRTNLNNHFLEEEDTVFSKAEKSLTVAQMDILKIKFATRRLILK